LYDYITHIAFFCVSGRNGDPIGSVPTFLEGRERSVPMDDATLADFFQGGKGHTQIIREEIKK